MKIYLIIMLVIWSFRSCIKLMNEINEDEFPKGFLINFGFFIWTLVLLLRG